MPVHYWILMALLLGAVLFVPSIGVLSTLRRWRSSQARARLEDALKHLLDRKQQGIGASPGSLAGSLAISQGRAMQLIEDMESEGLLETRGPELQLTASGERWALHVVRAHRLWERFLADEARMPLQQIHGEANHREHGSTPAQLDELDAALGYPVVDPHGDPIPTGSGSLARSALTPLTTWPLEKQARISHLEDEPAIAFQQILAAGLRLGQIVRILARTADRIILSDGVTEYVLAPAVASNVHVRGITRGGPALRAAVRLSDLEQGSRAEILMLDEAVQGFTRRRFLDLGLTPGTTIYPELRNFFGDPRGYRVRGTLIALRNDQAQAIWVKPAS